MSQQPFDAEFQNILDAISDGIYVTNDDREIVYWSLGAERITGFTAEEVVGKHCYDDILVHTDATGHRLCFDGCALKCAIDHGVGGTMSEVFLRCKDGERVPVYVKTTTFVNAGRRFVVQVFGELGSVAGSDLAMRVQELTTSSISDPLTELFNRRYLEATLEQQFAMFERMGRQYGILFLDVDDFKAVNDQFGHQVGDAALKFVADIIRHSARKMDVAARYGGDEFVLICSVATAEELDTYAKRLVALVRSSTFAPLHAEGMRLTVSVGGSMIELGDADEQGALERADQAMYAVKHAGCDGASVWDSGQSAG